jgi:hypothetical protein
LAAIVGCVLSFGCHRTQQIPWGSVRGKVVLADKPVSAGTVVFDNRELGVSRLAELRPDGTFVEQSVGFPGLPVGEYRVAVTPLPISKGDFVPVAPRKAAAGEPPIPARYRDVETSPLTATVKEGQNPPFVFELSRP